MAQKKTANKTVNKSKTVSDNVKSMDKPGMDGTHSMRMRSRRGPLAGVWSFIMWVVGVLVSLAVGYGMANGVLKVPWFGTVTAVAGWVVIVLTILGVILKIIDALSR